MITSCFKCGREFSISQSRIKLGKGIYCSRACSNEAKTLPSTVRVCQLCGKKLTQKQGSNRYCSRSCAVRALYLTKQNKRKCSFCNNYFTALSFNDRHCSRLCEIKENIAIGEIELMQDPWKTGIIPPTYYDKDYWRSPDPILGF